jgi:WD40 repeat protein
VEESEEKGLSFGRPVFSPDGKTIAATVTEVIADAKSIEIRAALKLWDAKSLDLKHTLRGDPFLHIVAFSTDNKLIAAGDPSRKTVTVWNAKTGALEKTLKTGEAQPWSLVFSPDSKSLAIGAQNADHSGEVQLWDARTWTVKHTMKEEKYVNMVAFASNGKVIASASGGDQIQLWDAQKGKQIRSLKGIESGARCVAFSPYGQTVAAGWMDGNVRLWDAETGKRIETLKGHTDGVYDISFSPDGKTLASVSQDATLRLWPLKPRAGERR